MGLIRDGSLVSTASFGASQNEGRVFWVLGPRGIFVLGPRWLGWAGGCCG